MEESLKKPKETSEKEEVLVKKSPPAKKSPKFIYGLIILFLILNIIFFFVISNPEGFSGKKKNVSPVSLDLVENINDLNIEGANTNTEVINSNTNTNTNVNVNTNTNTSAKVDFYKSKGLGLSLGIKPPYHLASGIKSSEDFFQAVTYDDTQAGTEGAVGLKIEITRENNSKNLSLLEWSAQHEASDEPSISFKETKVGGQNALEREVLTNFDAARTIYVGKSKKVYIVYVTGDRTSYDTYLDTTKAIIDSISFTK